MQILQVTPFFVPDIGGISDHVFNISKNLKMMGENVTIVSPIKIKMKLSSVDFNVIRIPSIYLLPWPYPTLENMSIPVDLGLKLDALIKSKKYDIIHAHGQHYPLSWIAINSAFKHKVPSVLTIHGNYGLNPFKAGGKTIVESCFNRIIFSRILHKTTAVIGLTVKNIRYAEKYSKRPRLFTIPNGINTSLFLQNVYNKQRFREKFKIGKDSVVILFCGRFEHVKGIIELSKAATTIAKEFDNVVIMIVGQGSLEKEIQTIVKGISNIHLYDWQSQRNLVEMYCLSDIFAIPSKFEGLPISLLEAMASSLHVLYTPVGSLPEVLENYPSKTLINTCSIDEIRSGLRKILTNHHKINYSKQYKDMNIFDWINIAEEVRKTYKIILNQS
jgi:glycosyltransferase involved in cell wall biosynthesis